MAPRLLPQLSELLNSGREDLIEVANLVVLSYCVYSPITRAIFSQSDQDFGKVFTKLGGRFITEIF